QTSSTVDWSADECSPDGANLGAEDLTSPYSVSWDTTTASNASHTLTAVARDAAANTTTSATITVTVANDTTAPVISAMAASSIKIGRASCRVRGYVAVER